MKALVKTVLSMCLEGGKPWRDANKLLKAHGLVLRWSGKDCGGDQVMLRLEPLKGRGDASR